MRMLDEDTRLPLREVALYLTKVEAMTLRNELDYLLSDPERNDHSHVIDYAGPTNIHFSIVTPSKLLEAEDPRSSWTDAERQLLKGKWDFPTPRAEGED